MLFFNYISFVISGIFFFFWYSIGKKYDVIFVFAPSPILQAIPAILLSVVKKVPLVLWVQDLWPESLFATGHMKTWWLLYTLKQVVRTIYRFSHKILVPSSFFIDEVTKMCGDRKKVCFYPNFYQPSKPRKFSRPSTKMDAGLKFRFKVVFAGNFGTAQSLDTIVSVACELLSNMEICFMLVGSGRLEKWLIEQKEVLGLSNLILTGRLDPSELPKIFKKAHALLVTLRPEKVFSLTIPSKMQAYLAAGKPILGSLNGAGAQIIQESGAGLCSEAGDAKALAENVLKLWKMNPRKRQKLGRNGRRYFDRHFAPNVLTQKLVGHFQEVINKGNLAK